MPGRMIEVEVQYAITDAAVPTADQIRTWARTACVDEAAGSLTVRVVSTDEARLLNRTYRQIDAPTNVLSFAADWQDENATPYLGDIAICASVVSQQAQDQGKALQAHWAHMVIHGVLHLQGYDHQQPADASAMERLEIDLLARFNYANPYL